MHERFSSNELKTKVTFYKSMHHPCSGHIGNGGGGSFKEEGRPWCTKIVNKTRRKETYLATSTKLIPIYCAISQTYPNSVYTFIGRGSFGLRRSKLHCGISSCTVELFHAPLWTLSCMLSLCVACILSVSTWIDVGFRNGRNDHWRINCHWFDTTSKYLLGGSIYRLILLCI